MRVRGGLARVVRWVVIPLIALSLLTQAAPPAHADGNELLNEYNQQKDKLKWLQEQKAKADTEIERVNIQVLEAQAQLEKVTQEVVEADSQLTLIKSQRAAAQDQYTKIQADLQKTQEQFDKKKATLAKRVRAISEDGRVTYLAVLFGAASFSDFINRFEMLKLVVKRDAELFSSVRKDKQVLEDKKAAALKRKNELDVLEAQAKDRFNVAEAKRTEKAQVSRSLDMNKRALAAQLDQLERQEQATRDELEAIMLSMNRPAGSFAPIWPVHGRITITDPFGPRLHPILGVARWHYGTDMAADMGQAVYAIEDGVVVQAAWDDAYGNLVVIDHGGGNSSWYGHSSVLLVKKGDQVKRGQQISKAGSTGWSTGPHVHLEIHIAGKPVDPTTLLPKQ